MCLEERHSPLHVPALSASCYKCEHFNWAAAAMVTGWILELENWELTRDEITFKRLFLNCAGVWKLTNENWLGPSAPWHHHSVLPSLWDGSFKAFYWSHWWCFQLILLDLRLFGVQRFSLVIRLEGREDGKAGRGRSPSPSTFCSSQTSK